eukprot:365800-Chlamydomonas_euryale.AAC.30
MAGAPRRSAVLLSRTRSAKRCRWCRPAASWHSLARHSNGQRRACAHLPVCRPQPACHRVDASQPASLPASLLACTPASQPACQPASLPAWPAPCLAVTLARRPEQHPYDNLPREFGGLGCLCSHRLPAGGDRGGAPSGTQCLPLRQASLILDAGHSTRACLLLSNSCCLFRDADWHASCCVRLQAAGPGTAPAGRRV